MDYFSFKEFSITEIEKELREVNSNKVTAFDNTPTKILKQSSKSCSDILQKLFNDALRNNYFPGKLKCSDVLFLKTKAKEDLKGHLRQYYRPVSVLPGASKMFERLVH